MKKTVLIMAGGKGERFWPKSRKALPKQFLSLTNDDKTMIQLTVERILPLVEPEDVFIATGADYKELVEQQLPYLPKENILCEPVGKNTAPCIGMGAEYIAHKYGDAIMMVLPSDHLIRMNSLFVDSLRKASEIAEMGENIVTIGITPNAPETGYGYINFDSQNRIGTAYSVKKFVEKPDFQTAVSYLESGDYLWNSGMFVWKVSTIQKCFECFLPEMSKGLATIGNAIGTSEEKSILHDTFQNFQSISVDYGIMEKAEHIYTIPGNFDWDDVGSWLAVERLNTQDENGNVSIGNVIALNTKSTIVQGGDKLIATLGVDNLIVVDTKDATLVCDKAHAGDIKKILEILKQKGMTEYL